MADDRIEIEIVLDDGSIQKGFAKVRQEGEKTEKSLKKNFRRALTADISGPFDKLRNSVFNVRTAFAGLVAVVGGGAFLRSVTSAAAQQEEAVNALNVSLQTAGTFSKEASQSFQELARELQSQSRFGDEVILQQAALARNYARSNEEAEKLVRVSVDLAEATGISLDSAVRNLGKTFSGLTGELGEAVPQVRGLTAEQLKAGAALDVLAQRFGGAALGATRTFAGATAQLSNTFGDLLERIGSAVTSSPVIINFINALSKGFQVLIKNLSGSGNSFNQFFENLAVNSLAAARAVIDSFSALAQVPTFIEFVWTGVKRTFLAGISVIASGVQKLFSLFDQDTANQLGKLVATTDARIAELDENLISLAGRGNEINDSFNVVRTAIDATATAFAELNLQAAQTPNIAQGLSASVEAVDPALMALREKVAATQQDINKQASSTIFDLVSSNRQLFRDTSKLTTEELKLLQQNLNTFKESTLQTATQISQAVQNGLGRAFASGIGAAIDALKKGQNAFEAFGKAFLGTIGDLAIQLGTFILTASLGLQQLFAGNPVGGIAFGAALIAIGSLLKSLSGGGFDGAGVGPGQDAVTSPILNEDVSPNLDDQGARVQINIQGDVLDGDETALRIGELLRDQGFNNAVVS